MNIRPEEISSILKNQIENYDNGVEASDIGTVIEVGAGKRKPEEMIDMLEKTDRCAAGPTAPAHGLTMIGIEYNM